MARIFKRPDRAEYYIDLTDTHGHRHRVAGYTSERPTAELARRLEQFRDCRQSGLLPSADARAWLEAQPPAAVAKWADMGFIERDMAAVHHPIKDLLDAFIENMKSKKRDGQHTRQTRRHIEQLCADAKIAYWTDATPERVRAALDQYGRTVTNQSRNGRLTAFRSFAKWSVKTKRAMADPTADIEKLDEKGERVHPRRPLTPDELRRLIAATFASAATVRQMSGRVRALIYLAAASTGWRWSELKRLRRKDFFLDDDPPMIAPPGWTQKSGRDDRLPLRADVAQALRDYFADAPAPMDAPAFPMPSEKIGAQMLRLDLAATGDPADVAEAKRSRGETPLAPIPYKDERGRMADFHALRYALATMVSRSGATVKVAQGIMRHSDPSLTLGIYTHAEDAERAAALEALPALLPANPNAATAQQTPPAATANDGDTPPPPAATAPTTGIVGIVGNCQSPHANSTSGAPDEKALKNVTFLTTTPALSNCQMAPYRISTNAPEGGKANSKPSPENTIDPQESGAISGAIQPGINWNPSENPEEEITDKDFLIVDEPLEIHGVYDEDRLVDRLVSALNKSHATHTVNLSGPALRWFESTSPHHLRNCRNPNGLRLFAWSLISLFHAFSKSFGPLKTARFVHQSPRKSTRVLKK